LLHRFAPSTDLSLFSALLEKEKVEPGRLSVGYGGDMAQATRILLIAILGMMFVSLASYAAEVDRAAVDFKTPSEIKW
jgi:hypothetical protein